MRRIARSLLPALALAAVAAGCYPLTSMRWSDSGAVGIVAKAEKGMLVDGKTGETTDLPALAAYVPSVSPDGKTVLYAAYKTFETLEVALGTLPEAQQAMVTKEADRLAGLILAEGAAAGGVATWPDLEGGPLTTTDIYRTLVRRVMCEQADAQARAALAPGLAENVKAVPIRLVQLLAAPVATPADGRVLATSLYAMSRPTLSPDGRLVAYVCHAITQDKDNQGGYDLWVSPAQGGPKAVRLAGDVALGFAWRPDSRALAYVAAVENPGQKIVGTLNTLEVAEAGGSLLAKAAPEGGDADFVASAEPVQRAGVVYNGNTTVAYLASGRLLLATAKVSLPMSLVAGDLAGSLFAYDEVTGGLADILPASASARISGQGYFELSPDGKRVLIPLGKEGFLVYTIGETEAQAPLPEGASAESAAGPPVWKGRDHVACWVNASSSLLVGTEAAKPGSDADVLVEVDLDGNLVRVLVGP